ncbi:MAG: glycoside hydrolase family 3 C-terminal domain-containing protein [Treponema sp.]|jgi:beta-glucosidase|nr:glycoside hydrolase family 3 C-terminal domain-containing protein [Treponema sp.]
MDNTLNTQDGGVVMPMDFQQAVDGYKNNPDTLEERIRTLCSAMTVKEKIYMLSGHTIVQTQKDMIRTGRNYNVSALSAGGCKRLGVPPVLFTDGPRGIVMGNSTCFPVSMLRASTFDEDLEYRIGKAIADEAIAQGANYFAGICINVVRNPRWGRCQETYGEDPFILGKFGAALTKSVQEEGMIACPKHFALNSIEDLRFYIDIKTDDRTLHEVYLPHFKKCVKAGAQSIMGAYNRYDESHCCENKKLLTDILRDQWGFDGFVISDFVWGVREAEHSLRAGLDIEMMFTMKYSQGNINKLLKKGKLTEKHLDKAVCNILRVLVRQVPNIKPRSRNVIGSSKNRMLAREVAEKGIVLLENNGVLPLTKDVRLAAGGPYANEVNIGDHGSSRVFDKQVITPYEGLKQVFRNVTLAADDTAEALHLAKDAEAVLLCVGNNWKKEGEYFANTKYSLSAKPVGSGGDRLSLRLEPGEIDLIKSMKKAGKKVIVALYSGCAILIDEWKQYADAVLMNYYSGCEGGLALARLLCGEVNFSGKLPFTVARTEADYPPIIGIGSKPYIIEYGYYHGYTKLDKENKTPAYPFGYGLSYTEFEIASFTIEQTADVLVVKTAVKNTGGRSGAEVVQVYCGSIGSEEGRPIKLLKGYKRVELAPDEEKSVQITIPKDELCFYHKGGWVLDAAYNIWVGNHSRDMRLPAVKVEVSV